MTRPPLNAGMPLADLLPDEFAGIDWTPTLPTVASPSWVGGDSIFFEGRSAAGVPLLARCLRPSAVLRVDCSAMFSAMEVAGAAALAPRVYFSDASRGVCIQEMLADRWQVATLYRLLDAGARKAFFRVRQQFRELAPDLPRVSVFDQVATLLTYARDHDVRIPPMAVEVIAAVREAHDHVKNGPEAVSCHGDGAVSNVMLSAGEARLVGWTQVGRMNPLEEIGSLLTELAPFIAEAEDVFEAVWGRRDSAAFAQARLCGVADDLRWALIGWCTQALHQGSAIEYRMYGNWRLFKARCAVTNGAQFARWLKEAA